MGRGTEMSGSGSHRCPGCERGVYVANGDSTQYPDEKGKPIWWHDRCRKVDEKRQRKAHRAQERRDKKLAEKRTEQPRAVQSPREVSSVPLLQRDIGPALREALRPFVEDAPPIPPATRPDPLEDDMTDAQFDAVCARVQTRVEDALVGMLADAERQIGEARALAGKASTEANRAMTELRQQIRTFAATYEERFVALSDRLLGEIADALDTKRIAAAIDRERERQRELERFMELRTTIVAHLRKHAGHAFTIQQLVEVSKASGDDVIASLTNGDGDPSLVTLANGRAFMWFEA